MRTTKVLGKRYRVPRQKEEHTQTISLHEHWFCILQGLQRRKEHTYSALFSPSEPADHQGCVQRHRIPCGYLRESWQTLGFKTYLGTSSYVQLQARPLGHQSFPPAFSKQSTYYLSWHDSLSKDSTSWEVSVYLLGFVFSMLFLYALHSLSLFSIQVCLPIFCSSFNSY